MKTIIIFPISLFIFLFMQQSLGNGLRCYGKNEIQKCVKECPPEKSCENKDVQFSCLASNKCELKCVCKEGFYRIYSGDCVSGETCDRCLAANEVFDCGSACDTTCATLNQPCPIVNIVCNEKCYCREGYARNDKNICIPISECKPNGTHPREARAAVTGQLCGPNEEYQQCKKTCPPDTCVSLYAKFKCDSNPPCVPGCVCKNNFLRATPNSPCMPIRYCSTM